MFNSLAIAHLHSKPFVCVCTFTARNSRRPNYISILDDASDLIRPLEKGYDTQVCFSFFFKDNILAEKITKLRNKYKYK